MLLFCTSFDISVLFRDFETEKKLAHSADNICGEKARNESYIPIFGTAENGLKVIQAKNIIITSFFHNNHLWHIGRQLAVVLLFSCTKKVYLKPFGKSYLHYLRPKGATRNSENAHFIATFDC